ncbi:MAG TPA: hypothetical protein VJZ04_08640 [Lachnospiraceae bacterium]|nr:hypothetical protein [Lachnospiraceae bacterium]
MEELKRKEDITRAFANVEYYPEVIKEANLTQYTKMPLSRIASYGVAFEPLAAVAKNIVSGGSSTSGLYRVSIPNGGKLAQFKDGSGYLGAVLQKNGAVGGGQARLNPIVCNSTMIFMAAALANINKKLDNIQEFQQEMMSFLMQKEKSKLRGNLNVLTDILNNYKYNWNNDMYKNSNHIKVLDIKQTSEQKIDFYREQIAEAISKKSLIHSSQDVRKQLEKVQDQFKEYQLALYLYAFSAFMEVILLENYESGYLDGISKKIEKYSLMYRELYTKSYDQIEGNAKTSIQSHLLNGVSSISKNTGKVFAKIPVVGKSQIDETLIETGDKLNEFGKKRTEQTMKQLIEKQSSYIRPFIENINTVNKLYNQPMEMIIDKENIYFGIS